MLPARLSSLFRPNPNRCRLEATEASDLENSSEAGELQVVPSEGASADLEEGKATFGISEKMKDA